MHIVLHSSQLIKPQCRISLLRYSGAHGHYYIKDFLKSVANRYLVDGRAGDFVLDLLRLKVPRLLALEPGEEEAGQAVQDEFKRFLQDFIRRNALKHTILSQITDIVVS